MPLRMLASLLDVYFASSCEQSVQENVDELLNLDTKFAPWNTERHEPGE
jgi:hypothetical protein